MAKHVIQRAAQDGGGYVAKPGAAHSYTRSLAQAQKFSSRETAEAQACSNERVIPLQPLLDEIAE